MASLLLTVRDGAVLLTMRQTIAAIDNTRPFPLESQAFGASRNHGGNGVHAPN